MTGISLPRFAFALMALLLSPPSLPGADPGDERWIHLFNGRNLDGWVNINSAPETWSVRDGLLHCTGKPISALRTEHRYENFILELEWRHLTEGGNSGVFIWASPLPAPGVPFLRGIEVQILDHGFGKADWFTTHGDVFPIHGATMTPFPPSSGDRSFPSENRSKGAPEWNHYRIVCRDGVIRLHVNGKAVSGGRDCNYRKGYIALESEGAPVEFRNIRIRELPSSGAPAAETAPLAEGHRTLFNGTDLRGWRSETTLASGAAQQTTFGPWQVEDWRLMVAGDSSDEATLWTTDSFGDAEFILDCRVPPPAEGKEAASPVVRLRGTREHPGVPITLPAEPGVWQRFTLQLRGDQVIILRGHPGVPIATVDLPAGTPSEGSLGLQHVSAPIEFANLFSRPLP